jgi:UDP-2,4-diacetamido-2,4,6-trideoxy-beta-L-altropyranose hydrolase
LLDQNYGSTKSKYQGLVPQACNVLAGADYALLRSEFVQWREYSLKRRARQQEIKTILVTLGGVDPDNYTGKVLQELAKTELDASTEVVVVMGATAPHLASIQQQAEKIPLKTTVKTNVTNMAEIMANADLAIGAAGATSWERCCLGLPTIQLVIAENQRQIALALAKDNIIALMEQIEELPGLLVSTQANLSDLRERSATVSNGLGCQRVVECLLEPSI